MNKKTIQEFLESEFPYARKGFISIIVDALELHSNKNHDYNGSDKEIKHSLFETHSKFADVRRKYDRAHHLLAENEEPKVDETLEDTIIDLGNYAFLLAEYLRK